jgi:hypothetical protein
MVGKLLIEFLLLVLSCVVQERVDIVTNEYIVLIGKVETNNVFFFSEETMNGRRRQSLTGIANFAYF